jgi:hypothetical protein
MIHEYELELQILKDKIQATPQNAGSFLGSADTMTVVDDPLRELRLMYLKLEQDAKDEKDVSLFSCHFVFHTPPGFGERNSGFRKS